MASLFKNLAQFNRELQDFSRRLLPAQIVLFQKRITLDLLVGIVLDTPVDTGRARGGWQTTLNSPTTQAPDRKDKTGTVAIQEAQRAMANLQPFAVVFIQNNVEYIAFLEDGTPKVAPFGMVRKNVQRVASIFGGKVEED